MTSTRIIHRTLLVTANVLALMATPDARAESEPARIRGAAVFSQYCVLCHGARGKGDGRAAVMQKVPPADLTASVLSPQHKRQIVLLGGTGVGRSVSMPAWAEVLTGEQIEDVLLYLDSLAASIPAARVSGAVPQ